MGTKLSQPLPDVSVDELATLLQGLGANYVSYADSVRDNGVNGFFVASLQDETELLETLDDLEIDNRLHRRVLVREWKTWKERVERQQQHDEQQQQRAVQKPSSSFPPSAAKVSIEQARQTTLSQHPEYLVDLKEQEIVPQAEELKQLFDTISTSYDTSEDTEQSELEGFDRIVEKMATAVQQQRKLCGKKTVENDGDDDTYDCYYAAFNLLDPDGHVALSSRSYWAGDTTQLNKERLHGPKEASRCYKALLCTPSSQNQVLHKLEPGRSPFLPNDKAGTYISHAARNAQNQKVGTLCMLVDTTKDDAVERSQQLLSKLASEAEEQLETRRVLVERNRKLRQQIDQAKNSNTADNSASTSIVLPAYGPIKAVTRDDVARRRSSVFPTQEEIAASGNKIRTAKLPIFQDSSLLASDQDMTHLPKNFWDMSDHFECDRTPIRKDDMERVALVEELGLKHISPHHSAGKGLTRLAKMAIDMFDVDFVEFSVMDHETNFGLAFAIGPKLAIEVKDMVLTHKLPVKHDDRGEPWLVCSPRGPSICNYVCFTRQTFTSHDVWADESFSWTEKIKAFKFYSSAPIFYGEHVVASFCMYDFKRPRPDFTLAHQMQQERIAELATQIMHNWVLRREMERLEKCRTRAMLDRTNHRDGKGSNPREAVLAPESSAAIIFTDVQGSTTLWESDSEAMHEALCLHDSIMRKCMVEFNGYEINTEGDAFHMAFHDSIDAVGFCLQVQTMLFEADWSNAILALPDACVDKQNCFRGLRVRMAIHYGDVSHRNNEVSGQREYTGSTVNIAKSVEHMSHGGQILCTSDVWAEASHVAASELGSPQVLDLGTHVMLRGTKKDEGVVAKGVVQLIPSALAYDWAPRGDKDSARGRRFPPVLSKKQIGASFHDAPCTDSCAAITFIYTSEIEKYYENASIILSALAKEIGSLLVGRTGSYQCKNFMLSFATESGAVRFGLDLQDYLAHHFIMNVSLAGMVKIGIHHGRFTSMVPSPQTGRADYYGVVVNRAARVAGAAEIGQVWLGLAGRDKVPELDSGLQATLVGNRLLKGVQEEMALYACSR